jgi:hypothetical protein
MYSGHGKSGARSAPYLVMIPLVALAGCSLLRHAPTIEEPIGLIAVLPIERAETPSVTAGEEGPRLGSGAERVVTAQIYAVLASASQWRFVPDLTVTQALSQLDRRGSPETQAQTLGKAVGADGVLFGSVSRYIERVGTSYGARQPAAVSFTLQLVSVASGKIVWTGSFDQAQQPLSANLFNWWQFWRGGPKWFTAQEFAHLGVERLLEDLSKKLGH